MAFSLRRFLEIGTLSYVVGDRIRAVEEADSHTLRLRLSRPSTSLQGLLTSINLTPVSPTAYSCLLYTSPSPRDRQKSRMPSSA